MAAHKEVAMCARKMTPDNVIVEARARIIWGEEPSSVHAFLTVNGVSTADADQKIQELVTERNKEVRKIGVRGTCIGAAIICAVVIFIWYNFDHPSKLFPSRQGKAMYYMYFVGLYGIWKLIGGLFHLLRPQLETQSISEMTE
jgi:hypothetical protein